MYVIEPDLNNLERHRFLLDKYLFPANTNSRKHQLVPRASYNPDARVGTNDSCSPGDLEVASE